VNVTDSDSDSAKSQRNGSTTTHVVFNAMSLRPGGGVTVLMGLIDGLVSQPDESGSSACGLS